jgi:hypothetical protein
VGCGSERFTAWDLDSSPNFAYYLHADFAELLVKCTHIIPSKVTSCWAIMAHAYNPSYSGGRDQKDHGSKTSPEVTQTLYAHMNKKKKSPGK